MERLEPAGLVQKGQPYQETNFYHATKVGCVAAGLKPAKRRWSHGTIALLVVLGLSGCGSYRKTVADITGYTKVCVNHVEYLQFPHGVTVQRNQHGGVMTCG